MAWDDNAVGYSYLANSPLLEHTYFTNAGALRMTTTRQFDLANRLKQIGTVLASAATINSFAYGYNPADQRTAITNADQSRWAYAYDRLGQVTNGVRYWSDNTPVAGQQFAYGFDHIGNRKWEASGGNEWGRPATIRNHPLWR